VGSARDTDGGLKSFGHPIGASGIRMMYECRLQLLGKAGPRRVKNPKIVAAHSLGGTPAVSSVTIFSLP
jgi:acetyl-CoA C-acetyltransferase